MSSLLSSRIALLASRVASEFNSVRGEISSLPTIDVITALFIDIAHPVGSWYASDDPTDPSVLFTGTTWQRLTGKKGLVACDNSADAGTSGGKSSITLTTAQLPSHTHTQKSMDTQGSHTHGRGSQDITGTFWDGYGGGTRVHTGAFSEGSNATNVTSRGSGVGQANVKTIFQFTASDGWSGASDGKGGHSHTVTLNNTGSGSSIDIMNPYRATYIWKRIS